MNDLAFLSSVSTAVTTALHAPATLAFFLFLKHMTLIPILGPFSPQPYPPPPTLAWSTDWLLLVMQVSV